MRIKLEDGAGGEAMQSLVQKITKYLGTSNAEVPLLAFDDSSVIDDIVFTTDSHTVKPLFFPGGNIGTLSVAGTINDISVMGARPIALSLSLIIEENFSHDDLDQIMQTIGDLTKKIEVPVITGDSKVVERGAAEKLFINTSGIGKRTKILDENIAKVREYRPFDARWILDSNLRENDKIIISGSIADHGIALMSVREGYEFEGDIQSDVTPLNKMIEDALKVGGIVTMKDPTRGGLANCLNEIAQKSKVGMIIHEEKIPLKKSVHVACKMLGLDPLEIGNEGKVVIGVVSSLAEDVLGALKKTKEGKDAAIIGEATKKTSEVLMQTKIGGTRIIDPPIGDPIPRIC